MEPPRDLFVMARIRQAGGAGSEGAEDVCNDLKIATIVHKHHEHLLHLKNPHFQNKLMLNSQHRVHL
jgi:hypothetical protein